VKKLCFKDKARRIRKTNRRRAVVLRRRRGGHSSGVGRTISAPRDLSFSRNPNGTLSFLSELKESVFSPKKTKRRGKWVSKSSFIDLSKIERISLPSAVVLSAELHRWKLTKGTLLKVKNSKRWEHRVRSLLCDLGAFELMGLHISGDLGYSDENPVAMLKLKSGERTDGPALSALQSELAKVSVAFLRSKAVYEALHEAHLNCIEHAYTDSDASRPKYPYAGHRWWATSAYDGHKNSLRFFVYDQGVGIPETIARKKDWQDRLANLFASTGLVKSDANAIAGAFEIGKSRTHKAERGKGLATMAKVVEGRSGGYLRILSGMGDVTIYHDGSCTKRSFNSHIGGTMVEWSIPVPGLETTNEN